jgi:hypothetical protein
MCSENTHGCSQNAHNDFGFDFFVVETNQQSKQWMHIHSPNKPKKLKKKIKTLSVCQKLDGNCFLGEEMGAGGAWNSRNKGPQ